MKGFFGKMFGGDEEEEKTPRVLEHPRDLQLSDILQFGFAAQPEVSSKSAKVMDINTYDFSPDSPLKTVFTLETQDGLLYLSVRNERGNETLEVGLRILPDDVDRLFGFEQFSKIFEHHGDLTPLVRRSESTSLTDWSAEQYFQEHGHEAYLYHGNYGNRELLEDVTQFKAFDYYYFVSKDRKFALQVEVFDEGSTEVTLMCYLNLHTIESFWPAG